MASNDKTKTLAEALVAFQAELPKVAKDRTNPAFKSKYATLESVTESVIPALNEHGFSFTVGSFVDNGLLVIDAHLLHTSGESRSLQFPITETNPQKIGSAITYARRYALTALTGVVADEDDDGNAASIPPAVPRALQQAQAAKPKTAAVKSEQNDLKKKIQEYIDGDEAKREVVNTVREKHVAAGLSGDDLFKAILAEVTA